MAKTKTVYVCQNCGNSSPKWQGKCDACGEWNTYVEEIVSKNTRSGSWQSGSSTKGSSNRPRLLNEIDFKQESRTNTQDAELNRVLGGGIMPGSLVLIGGEPGIGKSTLMLQIALQLQQHKVLYISGEESDQQIKMRAERMLNHPQLNGNMEHCYVLGETSTAQIFQQAEQLQPNLMIVDSIQTLQSEHVESAAGSVSQVRECTAELMKFAKETNIPVFLIGHINKEGNIAGPKVLEHMVDTVLQFEGDRHMAYRILRTIKNRFGSTSELGIYEMTDTGLRQVSNPSEILITQREGELSGITVGATLEGNRPLLIEIQSLVSSATYGTPQRSSTGFDAKRLNMLLAVLEKRAGYRLGVQDVFLNIAGGLKVEDPAIDLAVCASIVSSFLDVPISSRICFAAEVGLGGEIRAINRVENRISEAEKLGFEEIYISKFSLKGLDVKKFNIKIHAFSKLEDMIKQLLQ
ncbi:DNA repair protein RadA/Sms [Catalinimonas alkaloidigena]|uniref:DNA repair protein RadA n=1 Tax=Catalinimonas alkaloidigena TaxID=1075417 RepID=UPI00240733DC|nr:DNA repair protein RadA [Catalinimonas alkaloidigena]MDF9800444.1 DNA repair protein RadA/Sms [Catalinimonas alkaloidigena]